MANARPVNSGKNGSPKPEEPQATNGPRIGANGEYLPAEYKVTSENGGFEMIRTDR